METVEIICTNIFELRRVVRNRPKEKNRMLDWGKEGFCQERLGRSRQYYYRCWSMVTSTQLFWADKDCRCVGSHLFGKLIKKSRKFNYLQRFSNISVSGPAWIFCAMASLLIANVTLQLILTSALPACCSNVKKASSKSVFTEKAHFTKFDSPL